MAHFLVTGLMTRASVAATARDAVSLDVLLAVDASAARAVTRTLIRT
ncbi:MAG TPA: hypothetical protein K8W20_01815 [Pseudomonas lactis]|uniref:Uncharacterized protein n=1 Tax=Pseudomonas lactis TaxID=1615674 RepID=A0A921ND94_9PSED|nr:hypothetical protein [Pseudomonas lactis]HJH17438.1 hypothetical protein [Pseudomonas lactis]